MLPAEQRENWVYHFGQIRLFQNWMTSSLNLDPTERTIYIAAAS